MDDASNAGGTILRPSRDGRAWLWYVAAVVVSAVLAGWFLDLGQRPLGVPFRFRGDYMLHLVFARTAIDHGWINENPDLGAPFGAQFYDFPMPEGLHYLIIKVIHAVVPASVQPLNVFYLLTFPLTALTALLALRWFRFPAALAFGGCLLYTFLPYHFLRLGQAMLAAYYAVPLACIPILTVVLGERVLVGEGRTRWRVVLARGHWRRTAGALLICAIIGSTGIYYAAFAVMFLLAAGVAGAARRRCAAPLADGMLLAAVVVLMVLVNVAPDIAYRLREGPNREVAQRDSAESDIYGLKMSELLLPRSEHRVPAFAAVGQMLAAHPFSNENRTATLGLAMSIGFVVLLGVAAFTVFGARFGPLLTALSVLNLTGFLCATIGGMGTIFATLINPQFRGLNRICVFLAFFSLMAFLDLLKRPWRHVRQRWGEMAAGGVLAVLVALGLLDLTSPDYLVRAERVTEDYQQEKTFVRRIEAVLPAGAMVFQLPYMSFPEGGARSEIADYDHFQAYLTSQHLRFSYGNMKGRSADRWMAEVSGEGTPQMLRSLVEAGYAGLLIESRGYPGGRSPAEEVAALLGAPPLMNEKGDTFFFDLRPLEVRVRQEMGDAPFAAVRAALLAPRPPDPLSVDFAWGVVPEETDGATRWRWCKSSGLMQLENASKEPMRVRLRTILAPALAPGGALNIRGAWQEKVALGEPALIERTLTLHPGGNRIYFDYDGPPLLTSADSRGPFYWRFINLTVRSAVEGGTAATALIPETATVDALKISWSGAQPEESSGTQGGQRWRWCNVLTTLQIDNPGLLPVDANLHAVFKAAKAPGGMLTVGGCWAGRLSLAEPQTVDQKLHLQPGANLIHLSYDGPALDVPTDPRGPFHFEVVDFALQPSRAVPRP